MRRILDDEAKLAVSTGVVKYDLLPLILKLDNIPVKKATMQERQPRREEAKRPQQAGPVIRREEAKETSPAENQINRTALDHAFYNQLVP